MMRHRMAYCTLNSVIQQLLADSNEIDVSTTSAQNTRIALESANFRAYTSKLIYEVSGIMTKVMGHVFVPYKNDLRISRDLVRRNLSKNAVEYQLRLSEEILEIEGVMWIGSTLLAEQIRLANVGEFYPDYAIAMDFSSIVSLPSSFTDSVTVSGIFGYHRNPSAMFVDTGKTVQNAPLSSSGTTLNVTVGGGPSFEILQYLRIEDEYVLVTAISSDALTIERGKNGTTAVAHILSTPIEKFEGTPEIENEARRLAIRHWQLRGWPETAFIVSPEEVIEINPNAVQKVIDPLPMFGSV